MRRMLIGSTAFLALTATVLVLPVYAAPGPRPHPVAPSIDTVAMGSVTAPADDAVVTTDGQALPGGVSEAEATGTAGPTDTSSAPSSSSPSSSPSSSTPTSGPTTAPDAGDAASSGDELSGVPALTVSEPDTDQFSTVGVTWRQDDLKDVVVQLRVKNMRGHWGDWTTLQPDDIGTDATGAGRPDDAVRGGTAPYWTGPSKGVEVIVQGAGGVVPRDVKVALVDPGTSSADSLPQAPAATGEAHAADPMPAVYSRAQWGADESLRTWDPEYSATQKAFALHHTDNANDYTADQVPAMIRSIYSYHAVTRGWGDIGYNVIVDRFGRLFEGRYGGLASTVIGAHTGGFNVDTFAISMLGNYDDVAVPQATVNAVSEFVAWKFGLYGIDPRGTTTLVSAGGGTSKYPAGQRVTLPTIFGHRDTGTTTCPGKYGYARLGEIRDRVAAALPRYARTVTMVSDATTGNIPDVSPVQVSAVSAPNGMSTVFVRGLGNTIWYRTAQAGGTWSPFTAVPDTGATAGPGVAFDGTKVHLVVRGTSGDVWHNSAVLQADGSVGPWLGWEPLGGYATTAPTIATMAGNRWAVVVRGITGETWQRVWTGSSWSPWTSLGGTAYSAPVVQADGVNSRYLVSVVGSDNKVWQVGAGVNTAGPQGPWVGGGLFTSHTIGTNGASAASGAGTLLSIGGSDHTPVLFDPAAGTSVPLPGTFTSIAGLTRQPDGSTLVVGRGLDDALWVLRYRTGTIGPWISLGGILR